MRKSSFAAQMVGTALFCGLTLGVPHALGASPDRAMHSRTAMGAGSQLRAVQVILAHAYRNGVRLDLPETAVPAGQGGGPLAITELFARYAKAVGFGQIEPSDAQITWDIPHPAFDAPAARGALARGELDAVLATLPPPYRGYRRLVQALARYRAIAAAGGWPRVPEGGLLTLGREEDRVGLLRQRLAAEGFLPGASAHRGRFDARLRGAVIDFQRRHGLRPDGIVGPKTLAALNVPVERRVRQILANMERWRWLPRALPPRRAEVNIPAAQLRVIEGQKVVLRMRTVVGSPRHPTPVLQSEIRKVVINPPWNVPDSIWKREIFPRLRSEPGYLLTKRMSILGRTEDPHGLGFDWRSMKIVPPGIRLQQKPGPWNALGRVKFAIPNRFDVYLHDTPQRSAFSRPERALSHGCVRLQRPDALLAFLFPDESRRPHLARQGGTEPIVTETVPVARPLPVYLLYWTAFAGTDGALQFRKDIYGHDGRVMAALARKGEVRVALRPTGCGWQPRGA